MRMRTLLLLGLFASSAITVLHLRAGESPPASEQTELTIAQLHARLAELEERVQALEAGLLSPIVPAAGQKPPTAGSAARRPLEPSDDRIPPNWKSREINGLRYYIVPLGGEE